MRIVTVALEDIRENAWNPNVLSERKFKALASQIARVGFRQPIVVRCVVASKEDVKAGKLRYEIIDGEHRVKALRELGKTEVECVVVEDTDDEAKLQTLAMNMIHGEPDVLKLAHLIVDLNTRHKESELAALVGMTETDVRDYLAIAKEDDLKLVEEQTPKLGVERMLVFEFESETDYQCVVGLLDNVVAALKRGKKGHARERALLEICEDYAASHVKKGGKENGRESQSKTAKKST